MLKMSGVAMSGAVTVTTNVLTVVPTTLAESTTSPKLFDECGATDDSEHAARSATAIAATRRDQRIARGRIGNSIDVEGAPARGGAARLRGDQRKRIGRNGLSASATVCTAARLEIAQRSSQRVRIGVHSPRKPV